MPEWITPITNRTLADVTSKTKKGVLNASDFNRIEQNTAALAEIIPMQPMETKQGWQAGDLVFEKDIQRIAAGIAAVRAASLKAHPPALPGWMPEAPKTLASWQQANGMEAIQLRAKRAKEGNRQDTPYAGEPLLGAKTGVV